MEKVAGSSVKLSMNFYELAKKAAEFNHRSIAGQVEYWCRLGYAIEKKSSQAEIEKLLASVLKDKSSK
ncbi:MAG: hypothetical protein KBD37_05735 [Burkholderiales bacterium]|nr:hypothetical protein [Burkholderiales bacterium]